MLLINIPNMGISGLTTLLKKFAPETILKKKLICYSGKSVAIDTSLFMHKFMYNYGNIITGFFNQIYQLRRRGITPIYIFDGKPPEQKKNVLVNRKKAKEKMGTKIEILKQKLVKLAKFYNKKVV